MSKANWMIGGATGALLLGGAFWALRGGPQAPAPAAATVPAGEAAPIEVAATPKPLVSPVAEVAPPPPPPPPPPKRDLPKRGPVRPADQAVAARLAATAPPDPGTAVDPAVVAKVLDRFKGLYVGGTPDPLAPVAEIQARAAARDQAQAKLLAELVALGPGAVMPLLDTYGSLDARLKVEVREALVRMDEQGAWAVAKVFAGEPDARVRAQIVSEASAVKSPTLVAFLLGAAETDADAKVRANALNRISGNELDVRRLSAIGDADESLDVRVAAVRALSQLPGQAGIADLERYAVDGGEPLQGPAIIGLGRAGTDDAVAALDRILRRTDLPEELRIEAVKALRRIGNDAAQTALTYFSQSDSSALIRTHATAALLAARKPQ